MTSKVDPSAAALVALERLRTLARWPGVATPVDDLARRMGLEVATFDGALHPTVWGYLEPGEDLIFVRQGLSLAVRRFTLAHEIGHVMLHRRGGAAARLWGVDGGPGGEETFDACAGSDVGQADGPDDEALQPGQVYNARSTVEREANAFAVALLMPEESFLSTYLLMAEQVSQGAYSGRITRLLARRFGVSEDAALRRLQSLLAPRDVSGAEEERSQTSRLGDDGEQRAAAMMDTPALVMAGPGTGKTSTLVARVSYLALECEVDPEKILALTFSRKATEELRTRATGALKHAGVQAEPYVSTFHSFCLDVLGRCSDAIGLPDDLRLIPEIELYFLARDVMRETPLERLVNPFAPDMHVRDVLQMISRAKDDLLSPNTALAIAERMSDVAQDDAQREAAARQLEFAVVYAAFQLRLRDLHALDFGDVIGFVAKLLVDRPDIAHELVARWPHVLVDEYQDINHAMDSILRSLVEAGAQLWAVGDGDQAIYRFRGADPGIVRRFSDTFLGASVRTLLTNYRSNQMILDAASGFAGAFSQGVTREPLAAARSAGRQAPGQSTIWLASARSDDDELDGLARAITARQAAGRSYSDQVALLRTRRQVERVVSGLNARGIPTATTATAFESPTVKRILAVVSLLSEPGGAGLIRAGMQPEHAFDRADAVALIREARARRRPLRELLTRPRAMLGVSQRGQSALAYLGRCLKQIRASPRIAAGIALYCFGFTGIGARALEKRASVDAIALWRLLDLARAFDDWRASIAPRVGAEAGGLVADWRGFAEYLLAATTLRLDAINLVGSGPDVAVGSMRVMTVHASKGLEFPVVYLPQVANRRFPLTGRSPLLTRAGVGAEDSMSEGSDLSEEASLFYVAMTRARDELIMSYARRYGKAPHTISPFVTAVEEALGDGLIRQDWSEGVPGPESAGKVAGGRRMSPAPEAPDAVYEIAELESYQRCPRQYAYRYVDRLWAPPPLATLYGNTVRQTARELAAMFAQRRAQGSPPPARGESTELARVRWREALDQARRGQAHESGGELDALEGYYARQTEMAIERLWAQLTYNRAVQGATAAGDGGVEMRMVTVRLGAVLVRGEVEVRESGGSLDVVAPARVRSSGSSKGAGMRDLFVAAAAPERARAPHEAQPGREGIAASLSDRQRARLLDQVEAAAAGIAQGDFHPAPEERMCQRCPFAASCPE